MKPFAKSFDLTSNLSQLLTKEASIFQPTPDVWPQAPPNQLPAFSTARSGCSAQYLDVLSMFQVAKVWMIDHTTFLRKTSQAIVVVNCGQFKVVQQQTVTNCIPLSAVVGVSRTPELIAPDGSPVFGFKLCYIDSQPRHTATFGLTRKTDRDAFMDKLLKALVPTQVASCGYVSLHLCYLMVTRSFTLAWALTTKSRRLVFYDKSGVVADVDLRKMSSLVWETDSFVLNHPNQALRIRIFDTIFNWQQSVLNLANFALSQSLETQKLNNNNVPVIVAKCLDYIFVHGATSEGIYRKSGVTSKVTKLLEEFARNPFEVTIRPEDFTEHDVASALRKFFRDLPESVVGHLGPRFLETAEVVDSRVRIEELKKLIGNLPEIRCNTLREIVRHLNFIQTQDAVNKMSIKNLTIVWGKSLLGDTGLPLGDKDLQQKEAVVLSDLIANKNVLFDLQDDDLAQDVVYFKAMQKSEERGPNLDLVIWIHMVDTKCRVVLTRETTVADLCKELAGPKLTDIALKEVLLGGELFRYMQPSEIVLDVVSKWSNWPVFYRKHNFLEATAITLSTNTCLTVTQTLHVKVAGKKSYFLAPYIITVGDNQMISSSRESYSYSPLSNKQLNFENKLPFLGSEKQRSLTGSWCITLIKKDSVPELPFIGQVLAMNTEADQLVLYRALSSSA